MLNTTVENVKVFNEACEKDKKLEEAVTNIETDIANVNYMQGSLGMLVCTGMAAICTYASFKLSDIVEKKIGENFIKKMEELGINK